MFVSQYVCFITFTLFCLVSYLHTECYGLRIPDYADPNYTSRIKRESCRCVSDDSDCSDESDESPEISVGTPVTSPPTLHNGSCTLPPQPANGLYTVNISSTVHILTYLCWPGYQISPALNNNVAICDSGTWHPALFECVRTCAPRISHSVDTDCEHKGIKVDCSKPMVEGTTVRMNCKPFYSQVNSSANRVSVCRCGFWNYALIKCEPECGNLVPQTVTLVPGGENSKKITYPWHVGVYKLNATNQYNHLCGGSLVSPKVIVSAAHCFTNYTNGAFDDEKHVVAAGKYYRNYYDERDTLSQTSKVEVILIPSRYNGLSASFEGDIAFVILDKAFELTAVVQPVCIDWDQQYEAAQLKENNTGIVVGWGYTDAGSGPNAELKELSVPFVNRETCSNAVPESCSRFLTRDKFCAKFTNDSSVCHGDGGGGLVFLWPDNKKYYLHGSASVCPMKDGMCDFEQYSTYTKVSDYIDLLLAAQILARI